MGFATLERIAMKMLWLALVMIGMPNGLFAAVNPIVTNQNTLIVVVGAGGEEKYAQLFQSWANAWEHAATNLDATPIRVETGSNSTNDLEQLKHILAEQPKDGSNLLWLILIGHGTFDGEMAKFNLRGPDLSAAQLADWLRSQNRPTVVINNSACSGPFIDELSRPDRVVITATQNGDEENFTRFPKYLVAAISDSASDFDKDGRVSLFEAFIAASANTEEFYAGAGLLSTEHALIDDNGDRRGTALDWFRDADAVKALSDKASMDGQFANQLPLSNSAKFAFSSGLDTNALNSITRTLKAIPARRDAKSLQAAAAFEQTYESLTSTNQNR
jgi:hypothetical protein